MASALQCPRAHDVVRHVKKYSLQILEDTQVVKFRCLCQAVDDGAGFGTGRCIVEVDATFHQSGELHIYSS